MCNKTSSEKVLVEHKGICLQMNRKQAVELGSGSIKFQSHFKQLAVPFNFHADFESVLKGVRGSDTKIILHTLKNIRNTCSFAPCSFAYKVVGVDDIFSKAVVLYRDIIAVNRFIEVILEGYDYFKKVIKKHFDKNLV